MKETPHGYAHSLGLPSVDKFKKIQRNSEDGGRTSVWGLARANPRKKKRTVCN